MIAIAAAATACGDNNECAPGLNLVRLCLGEPVFVAYRDGDGDWLAPISSDGDGSFNLCVADDFVATVVYENDDGTYWSSQFAGTVDDPRADTCNRESSWSPDVEVTGSMMQPGSVSMNGYRSVQESYASAWDYTLLVAKGTHDLVATSVDGRIAIRRGVVANSNVALPLIDMDAEGTALLPVMLEVTGLEPSDAVSATVRLAAGGETSVSVSQSKSTIIQMVPEKLQTPGDEQTVVFGAVDGPYDRGADVRLTGATGSVALLPKLASGVMFDPAGTVTVDWPTLPETYTGVILSTRTSEVGSSFGTLERLFVSRRWIEGRGITSLGFDATPPGYSPLWRPDTGGRNERVFSVLSDVSPNFYWTSFVEP